MIELLLALTFLELTNSIAIGLKKTNTEEENVIEC